MLVGELIQTSPIRPFAKFPIRGEAVPSTLDTRPSTLAAGANDYLGNVIGLLDPDTGNLVAEYVPSEATTCRRSPTAYDPFGRQIRATGTYADKNSIRFSSQYTDNETGLVYFGFRHHHPEWGRFINRDPIEEEGGENLYRFVSNDPVNRWDLNGLVPVETVWDAANVAMGLYSMGSNLLAGNWGAAALDAGGVVRCCCNRCALCSWGSLCFYQGWAYGG